MDLTTRGVTTNSDSGILSYEQYYPVFEAMQQHDLILNLHGEVPPQEATSSVYAPDSCTILTAETSFLPTLKSLHARFPRLRIVLEHCTTADALATVMSCGPTVVATITPHHLFLTVDSWAGDPFNYCKPVAKKPSDREALVAAATSGNSKFFLGSDSAPHAKSAKLARRTAAGVFSQPYLMQYVTEIFERAGRLDCLEGFVATHGRRFYRVENDPREGKIVMVKKGGRVKDIVGGEDGVVPFRAGEKLAWDVIWTEW
jgi:dihydroorotase